MNKEQTDGLLVSIAADVAGLKADVRDIKEHAADVCPVGARNATAIKWLYAFYIFAVGLAIKYFPGE